MPDLFEDLRAEITAWLPHDRERSATRDALAAKPVGEMLIIFCNWLGRLVHPHPRSAQISLPLHHSPLLKPFRAPFEELIRKIEAGESLMPHLSRKSQHGFALARRGKKDLGKRPDLDLMLNDWGIHHLHLSHELDPDGFVKRTGPLLYAIFTDTDAFLLDILEHGNWTNMDLAEIAVRNWPSAGLFLEMPGLLPGDPLPAHERSALRRVGLTPVTQIDGRCYMPRSLGMSTAGTTTRSAYQAGRLMRQIRAINDRLKADPHTYRQDIVQRGEPYPDAPSWRLVFGYNRSQFGFAVKEQSSGVVVEFL